MTNKLNVKEEKKSCLTLNEALTKFQDLNIKAIKDSTNPHFRSKYADLTSVINAVNHGAEFGLSFTQVIDYDIIKSDKITTVIDKEGVEHIQKYQDLNKDIFVITTISHIVDKDILRSKVPVLINGNDKDNPQKMGSAITYAKRYGLQSLYGLASDDDANSASEPTKEPRREHSI
tara:strand:+ start:1859 stop:2383 length:525 start_codon:yes stop_codon:yes gene_type:complete